MVKTTIFFALLFQTINCLAIVKRHDVSEENYKAEPSQVSYLIDMPGEGHAVLIKDKWLITVGHVIFWDYKGMDFEIKGVKNKIADVIFHPDYIHPPKDFDYNNSHKLKKLLSTRSDVALIRLKDSVKHLTPIALYEQKNEVGKQISVFGKGATGDGESGMIFDTKHQKDLRYCNNTLNAANDKWLSYTFNSGDEALPLEGIHGSGDSGGASVIYIERTPFLVGLSSWQWQGDKSEFAPMLYGTTAYQVRISSYIPWINEVISGSKTQ
jgi:hypothetical protein